MKKRIIITASVTTILAILVIVVVFFSETDFSQTLDTVPQNIERIKLNTPLQPHYKTTTDQEKIQTLLEYFSHVTYERLAGDKTAYMPGRASIIYLYDQDQQSNFIVPYANQVMINYKVYKVHNGTIETDFINNFYQSLH